MRVFALILVGFVLALVLAGIIGGGVSGRGEPDRGSAAADDGTFADRIGLAEAGAAAAPSPLAGEVGDAPGRPGRASPAASPWSVPAEFAPVDPIR